jgi:hypothetical protein
VQVAVPASAAPAGKGLRVDRERDRSWSVRKVLVVGLLFRAALIPFHHPWDLQTFAGTWADMAHGRSPYERMEQLSLQTSSSRGTTFAEHYEYFAYPPGLLYLEYPLAKLYGAAHPDFDPSLSAQNVVPTEPIPFDFMVLFKLPLFAADVAIFFLLVKMAGAERARRFFLNPYVIVVSAAWMFDSLVALTLLLAVYAARELRWGWAGVALAAGTLLKFSPAFVLPAFAITAWREDGERATGRLFAGFAATLIPLSLPFLPGIASVMSFHAGRPGGGLTWMSAIRAIPAFRDGLLLEPGAVTSALGTVTLVVAMAWSTIWVLLRKATLEQAVIVMFVAFLLGSKVVNEQYVVPLVPLLLLAMPAEPTLRHERAFTLAWTVPLVFGIVNVPFFMFLVPAAMHVVRDPVVWLIHNRVVLLGVDPYIQVRAVLFVLLAAAFVVVMVMVLRAFAGSAARAPLAGGAEA